ncbi:unnamed protein product [Rotaria magnacalcarata]|uniref:Multidrug and toxin extrusion protein n=1 Tax=Rotaria magnacalcarata TaxID=392030 RepID=A0A816WPV9_9BILA|nr:unnamed protein product [Rotaria magnacalcarata]
MSKTQVKLCEYFSANAASIKSKRVSSLSSITSEREHEPSLSSSSSSSIVQMEFGLFSSSLSTTSVEYGSSGSTITTEAESGSSSTIVKEPERGSSSSSSTIIIEQIRAIISQEKKNSSLISLSNRHMKEKSSPVSKSEKNNTGTSKNDDIGSVQSEMKTLQTMNDDIKIDKVSELVDDEIQRETILIVDGKEESNKTKSDDGIFNRLYPFGLLNESKTLLKITIPFAFGNVLQSWFISFVSLVFMGQLGLMERNACALALSTYVLIGNSLMLGLNFGCDTLLPQCYGGNKRKMGLTIQRSILITIYGVLISWTLMLNAKYLLNVIEHDREVVVLASQFLKVFVIVLPFDALAILLLKYIAANEKTWPLLIITLIGNGVNALSHYVCLFKLGLGIYSAPISIALSYFVITLCAMVYIRLSSIYRDTWHPITKACLQEWNIYLRLSAPGVCMILTEFWSVELSILFAARLGTKSLSAQVCAAQTEWLLFLITSAYAMAGNIRIGQFLGAGKPQQARNCKNVIWAVGAMIILINLSLVILLHRWIPLVYNTEPEALVLAKNVLILIAIMHIWDGYNIISTGIVKACGKQKRGAMISLTGFYVFGIPLAAILMFSVKIDIYGFWIGIIAAETITNVFLLILIRRFNWEKHSSAAVIRIDFNPFEKQQQVCSTAVTSVVKNDESLFQLMKIKLVIFIAFLCLLIFGIFISIKIPL